MGSKNTTTTQKADPWKASQPYLRRGLRQSDRLYRQGGYGVPDPSEETMLAQQMTLDRAGGGAPLVSAASGTLQNMMDPQYQSGQLEQVKQNALGTAIPAAVSMFSGSGMTNSSQAMDTVGRAATEAVAPYEYDAYNTAQSRALAASGMAPGMEQAGYLPAQMTGSVGAARDALAGSQTEGAEFQRYLSTLLGLGGMGGSQSTTQPGPSALQTAGGAALGGLGTYGALAANPATAGFALLGGLGSGLLGLL